jgi:metal-dependent HD superfamily phosphatase/phosphodiesterase
VISCVFVYDSELLGDSWGIHSIMTATLFSSGIDFYKIGCCEKEFSHTNVFVRMTGRLSDVGHVLHSAMMHFYNITL